MEYIAVEWIPEFQDEPVMYYCELDAERWEVRRVEIYRDGTMQYMDSQKIAESAALEILPVPSLEKIGSDPEFRPVAITKAEFEERWQQALRQNADR